MSCQNPLDYSCSGFAMNCVSRISFVPVLTGYPFTHDLPRLIPHIAKLNITTYLLRQTTASWFIHVDTISHTRARPTIMTSINDSQILHH